MTKGTREDGWQDILKLFEPDSPCFTIIMRWIKAKEKVEP